MQELWYWTQDIWCYETSKEIWKAKKAYVSELSFLNKKQRRDVLQCCQKACQTKFQAIDGLFFLWARVLKVLLTSLMWKKVTWSKALETCDTLADFLMNVEEEGDYEEKIEIETKCFSKVSGG